jgi:hypothetical protein
LFRINQSAAFVSRGAASLRDDLLVDYLGGKGTAYAFTAK